MSARWDRHVAIVIATFEEAGQTTYRISTGCAVAPTTAGGTRLVTTRHGLVADAGRCTKIEVAFQYRRDDLRAASIVWESASDDLALLECAALGTPAAITAAPEKLSEDYTAVGYARAGKLEERRPPVALGGKLYPYDRETKLLHVGVDHGPPKSEGWAGASGAPVFIGDALVGLIKDVPDDFGARRLEVIDLERVMRTTPGLRALVRSLDETPFDARLREIRRELTQRLSRAELQRLDDETTEIVERLQDKSAPPSAIAAAQELLRDIERASSVAFWRKCIPILAGLIAASGIGLYFLVVVCNGGTQVEQDAGIIAPDAAPDGNRGVTPDPDSANDDKVACKSLRIEYTDTVAQLGNQRRGLEQSLDAWQRNARLAREPDADIVLRIKVNGPILRSNRPCMEVTASLQAARGRRPEPSPPAVPNVVVCPPGRATDPSLHRAEAITAWNDRARTHLTLALDRSLIDFRRMHDQGIRFVSTPSGATVLANARLEGDALIDGDNWGLAKPGRVFGCLLRSQRILGYVTLPDRRPAPFEVTPAKPATVERFELPPR